MPYYILQCDSPAHACDTVYESPDDTCAMQDMWVHVNKSGIPIGHAAIHRLDIGRLNRSTGVFGTASVLVFDSDLEDDEHEPEDVVELVQIAAVP